MLHLFAGLDLHTGLLLLLALVFVLFYEAINGFHDTANAVATVIYTRAMRSQLAVVMAAVFNFFGVLLGGLSVAYAIVHMLPTDLLLNVSSGHGLAMVFSMLLAAIIWNLGTWYFGLPASSSHTLIGAIIGIGLTNALMTGTSVVDALNLPKVLGIFGSLIISPIVGLVVAGGLIFILRRYWSNTKKRARIHLTPAEREKKDGKKKPPFWTRIALIISAIGVAFSHGANDGQKERDGCAGHPARARRKAAGCGNRREGQGLPDGKAGLPPGGLPVCEGVLRPPAGRAGRGADRRGLGARAARRAGAEARALPV